MGGMAKLGEESYEDEVTIGFRFSLDSKVFPSFFDGTTTEVFCSANVEVEYEGLPNLDGNRRRRRILEIKTKMEKGKQQEHHGQRTVKTNSVAIEYGREKPIDNPYYNEEAS